MAQPERQKRLESTVAALQKRWGARALHKARESPAVPVCPSGLAELDCTLGIGGFPRGRFSELIGWGTAGHWTVAAHVLAQAQQQGDQVAYVDVDAMVDVDALVRCGVQLGRLAILRPHNFRHALTMTDDLLHGGGVGVTVFDRLRVAPLQTEGEAFERALRDWTPVLSQSLGALLMLTEPGADASPLAHFASLRLAFARQRWLYRRQQIVGYVSQVQVLKNRLGPAGQSVALKIMLEPSDP